MTTEIPMKAALQLARGPMVVEPEFIRIPKPGLSDPVFGMTRSWWYRAEVAGLIRFKRIRLSGERNGATLIPVRAAREMFARIGEEEPVQ